MLDPLITTIIPTYRRPDLLRRAILSALEQSERRIIVHIFDNCSNDETVDVVRSMRSQDSRVRLTMRPHNIGGAENIASATREVATPFFSILCDDDLILPSFYESAYKSLELHPDAMMYSSASLVVDSKGKLIAVRSGIDGTKKMSRPESTEMMAGGKHPDFPAAFFRTDVLKHVGGFDADAGSLIDIDFYIRIASQYPIVFSNIFGGILVDHEDSWSNNVTGAFAEYNRIIDRIDLNKSQPGEAILLQSILRSRRDLRTLQLAFWALDASDYIGVESFIKVLGNSGSKQIANLLSILNRANRVVPVGKVLRTAIAFRLRAIRFAKIIKVFSNKQKCISYDRELKDFLRLTESARSKS